MWSKERAAQVSRPYAARNRVCTINNSTVILRLKRHVVKIDRERFSDTVLAAVGGILGGIAIVVSAIIFFVVFGG